MNYMIILSLRTSPVYCCLPCDLSQITSHHIYVTLYCGSDCNAVQVLHLRHMKTPLCGKSLGSILNLPNFLSCYAMLLFSWTDCLLSSDSQTHTALYTTLESVPWKETLGCCWGCGRPWFQSQPSWLIL